jgi:Ser/Thr protein kinase RdoA (MazF antagonist)
MIDLARDIARTAAREADVPTADLQLVHAGENVLFHAADDVIIRVSRPGQTHTARKELAVAAWLASSGIPVVEPTSGISQPLEVDGHAVTFWKALPHHREGSGRDIASVLRAIHSLPRPPGLLPCLEPFARLSERIVAAGKFLDDSEIGWLLEHLARLQQAFESLPDGEKVPLHGDAWGANIVSTKAGPVVLDLERFSLGPAQWDLTVSAVDYGTFGTLPHAEWQAFCDTYEYDVTQWDLFPLFRDIRELRKTTFAVQVAQDFASRSDLQQQARYRIQCIQGAHGPRPWGWRGVP